jgi:hypothetical protein
MKWQPAAVGLLVFCVLAASANATPEGKPGKTPTKTATKPVAGTAAFSPAAIDQMISTQWGKQKIVPAPPVDDARFLRRAYLEIVGVIPTAEAVSKFLADKSPDKRARVVAELVDSPRYAENWTNYWDTVLMGRQVRAQVIDRVAWRQWLHGQFAKNVPWNKFAYDLITATGVNSSGGSVARAAGIAMPADRRGPAMAGEMQDEAGGLSSGGKVNGAVNWLVKYAQTPADLSGQASKVFLGVQIQCAQCHDHKTEKWKQDDFRRFTACFMNARPFPVGEYAKGNIRRVEVRDVYRPFVQPRNKQAAARNEYISVPPAALDGTDFANSQNRRQALAEWMTAPENPYFAEAIVNRMWAHFMGRGFVEPIDDFRETNPAVMPELLKKLADDFVAHDYDLKHLVKTICATKTYQLSSAPFKGDDPDNTLWARYRLKSMGPDEMLDSLVTATNLGTLLERVAGGNLDNLKMLMKRQFTFLFDTDEETEEKEFEGTIPQALLLLNSSITNRSVSPIPGTALAQVLALPGGDAQKIESLYLRTLSRKPTTTELKKWTEFLNAPRDAIITDNPVVNERPLARRGRPMPPITPENRRAAGQDPLGRLGNRFAGASTDPKVQAYEDLFWALLNSSEFMFNH